MDIFSLGSRMLAAKVLPYGVWTNRAFEGREFALPAPLLPGDSGFSALPACPGCARAFPVVEMYQLCIACCKKKNKVLPLKPGCSMIVTERPVSKASEERAKEAGLITIGPFCPYLPYLTAANTRLNMKIAVARRQLVLTNPTSKQVWDRVWDSMLPAFGELFPNFPRDLHPTDFDAWLAKCNCRANTKRRIQDAKDTIGDQYLCKAEFDKQMRMDCFVKKDKYDKCGLFEVDPTFANRNISPFTPYVNSVTGPVIDAIQQYLHREWNDWILFAAGCNTERLSDWVAESDHSWTMLENDFSYYDSSISTHAQAVLIRLYSKTGILEHAPSFHRVKLAQSMKTSGRSRLGIKMIAKGTMKSGASDTCLGNSVLNVFAHLHCLAAINHCAVSQLHTKVRMAILGDDNIMFVHPSLTVVGLAEEIAKLGFTSKLKQVSKVTDLVFLNNRLYPTVDGLRFGPLLGRLLTRLGFTTKKMRDSAPYIEAISQGFAAPATYVPVLANYVARIHELTGRSCNAGVNKRRLKPGYATFRQIFPYKPYSPMTHETTREMRRHVMFEIYGITDTELGGLETLMNQLPALVCSMSSPALERIIDRDVT
jgi:hypothetical protein